MTDAQCISLLTVPNITAHPSTNNVPMAAIFIFMPHLPFRNSRRLYTFPLTSYLPQSKPSLIAAKRLSPVSIHPAIMWLPYVSDSCSHSVAKCLSSAGWLGSLATKCFQISNWKLCIWWQLFWVIRSVREYAVGLLCLSCTALQFDLAGVPERCASFKTRT